MKTHDLKPSGMTAIAIRAISLATLLLAVGCVVTSVYPFHTGKDLVFEPALLGDWNAVDDTNQPPSVIRVTRIGEKGYGVTDMKTGETAPRVYHLFQLKGHLFLDECATNGTREFVPVHKVSKVIRLEPRLETADINYDWLAGLLERKPRAIRHLRLQDGEGDKHRIVLTAETSELQRFILKHLNDTNAWNKPSVLVKLP